MKCGAPVGPPKGDVSQPASPQRAVERESSAPAEGIVLKPKRKKKAPIVIGLVAAIVVVAAVVAFIVLRGGEPMYVLTEYRDCSLSTPDATTFAYDDAGNLTGVDDYCPKGYERDASGFATSLLWRHSNDRNHENPYSSYVYENKFNGAGQLVKSTWGNPDGDLSKSDNTAEFEYYEDGSLKEYRGKHDILSFDKEGYLISHRLNHGGSTWSTGEIAWKLDADGKPVSYTVTWQLDDPSYGGSTVSTFTVDTDEAGNIVRVYGENGYGESQLVAEMKYKKIDASTKSAKTFAPYIMASFEGLPGVSGCDYSYLM